MIEIIIHALPGSGKEKLLQDIKEFLESRHPSIIVKRAQKADIMIKGAEHILEIETDQWT